MLRFPFTWRLPALLLGVSQIVEVVGLVAAIVAVADTVVVVAAAADKVGERPGLPIVSVRLPLVPEQRTRGLWV